MEALLASAARTHAVRSRRANWPRCLFVKHALTAAARQIFLATFPSNRGRSSSQGGTARKRKRTHTPWRNCIPKQTLTKTQRQNLRKRVKPLHSFARFDVFGRGMVWGMHLAGVPREDIVKLATKKDGSLILTGSTKSSPRKKKSRLAR